MPSENNKKLQQAFAPILKAQGFKKTGATWRKFNTETIFVFNIQGSQWGPQFYINLGVLFREIDKNESPLEYDCHIRERLDKRTDDEFHTDQLLDFDFPIPEEVRLSELKALVIKYALPFFNSLATKASAREAGQQFPFLITLSARTYLGLQYP